MPKWSQKEGEKLLRLSFPYHGSPDGGRLGSNRTEWAFLNRLRVADVALDTRHADAAAAIRSSTSVSLADAHLGAVVRSSEADQITVVSSDPDDVRLVAVDTQITIVTI